MNNTLENDNNTRTDFASRHISNQVAPN